MANRFWAAGVLALVCFSAGGLYSRAQATDGRAAGAAVGAGAARGMRGERLRMVVILSRHGVRSPTWTQERLNSYSAMPWPVWSVPPGNLTVRGYGLVRQFAGYDRAELAREGLLAPRGCADASKMYVWADTDQRTVASGKALAEGFFPGCPPEVHSLAGGANDPLFHPTAGGVSAAEADGAFAELAARVSGQPSEQQAELIAEMQHVLLGCSPKIACTPAHAPETPLLDGATAAVRGKGDHSVDLQGPLAQSSTFAEDLLLEYADGMPASEIGWGKVDEAQLRRFLELHSDYFDLMHRTPSLARLEASNMLRRIVRTLEQSVEQKPLDDAIGPANAKLVVLAGHDTNIASVAALLGLHWRLDGRDDDTPPGTELSFELWQSAQGGYSVRVTVAMQTLRQLRAMQALTPAAPPAHETLTVKGCAESGAGCAWEDFRRIANPANDVSAALPTHSD